jgi:hypothetical protein
MQTKQSNPMFLLKLCFLFVSGLIFSFAVTKDSFATPYQAPAMAQTTAATIPGAAYQATDIALTPGATISELNFAWYSTSKQSSLVQIALKSALKGSDFPVDSSQSFYCTVSPTSWGYCRYYNNKTVVCSLTPATEYVYRLGDGNGNWTPVYDYTTRRENQFGFLAVGDPQIGAGSTSADTKGWTATMTQALNHFPDAAFLLSAGDQVESCNNSTQFSAFLAPAAFKSLPIAPALGNHDAGASDYGNHFNLPNLSNCYGVTYPGSADYYFTYGNTLFMVLNSNNTSSASHAAFIRTTVNANPNFTWRIVMFHYDVYGSATHSMERTILNLRASLVPIFDDYAIDIAINGHDHSYTRTYPLKGDLPRTGPAVDQSDTMVDPDGTVYYTLNSASGSKYYDLNRCPECYAAVRSQIKVPTFSYVEINGNMLSFHTYRADTMERVDSCSIIKTAQAAE